MIKIQAQYDGTTFHPYSDKDIDETKDLLPNQLVTLSITGIKNIPSIKQLNTYWSACTWYAENTDDKYFKTSEMVSDQLKVELNFIDLNKSFVDKHGNFHPHYHSISFDNLKQIERTRFIDRAFDQMAAWKGITRDDIVRAAKERCKRF